MMERLGVSAKPLPVVEAVFKLQDRELVVKNPTVTLLDFQGQKILQVVGESLEERMPTPEAAEAGKPSIPEEDVSLVASQAGVSLEEAREALAETGGDLAQAILLLASKRR